MQRNDYALGTVERTELASGPGSYTRFYIRGATLSGFCFQNARVYSAHAQSIPSKMSESQPRRLASTGFERVYPFPTAARSLQQRFRGCCCDEYCDRLRSRGAVFGVLLSGLFTATTQKMSVTCYRQTHGTVLYERGALTFVPRVRPRLQRISHRTPCSASILKRAITSAW